MTCIDVHKRAELRSVRYEDYKNGRRRIAKYLAEHRDTPIHQRQIDAIKILPEREMVAVIRMDGWERMHPDLFTWDGLKA